uniref:Suppressor of forked domain-containing protein n=2 Tax=Arcella intermedia TaxID=1963864 RepID=A0A6B2KZI8_9EUKA
MKDKYETDAWATMISEAQGKPIAVARIIYEEFLDVFPTAGRYWKIYIEQELAANNFDQVEKLFTRCLKQCPNVDLWKCYIKYILDYKAKQFTSSQEVINVFEFAIGNVGMDIAATPIWTDYIHFVKTQKTGSQFEESQKMESLRKLYQRAVVNPMHNLENIWNEYNTFENGLNKILAKALLTENGPKYMQARTTYRERKNYLEGIQRNLLARPPRNNVKDLSQVKLWKKLIAYEKRNPQRLDDSALRRRITFTYNQCLLCLYRYPEIWHEAAHYQLETGHPDDAMLVFQKGLIAVEDCLLLHFAYADFLETQDKIPNAKTVYENLIEKKQDPLIFIEYMRFTRRAAGIKEFRKVFFRARKSRNCTYQVYVAAAQIEQHVNKDIVVARKIYELGLRKFLSSTGFLLQYINFLVSLGDDVNARALFEKILSTLPAEKAPEIWNSFQKFEILCGNLESIIKLEKRRSDTYPTSDPNGIYGLVQRYRYLDLWPCSPAELASFEGGERPPEEEKKDGKPFAFEQQSGKPPAPNAAPANKEKFIKPDLSKLIRYKVEMGCTYTLPNSEKISLPPNVSQFLNSLPLGNWDGPSVDADQLITLLLESATKVPAALATGSLGDGSLKRKLDDMDEGRPPASDIYRERQAAKLAKTISAEQAQQAPVKKPSRPNQ